MNTYNYINGGFSAITDSPGNDNLFDVVAVFSTATMGGGDQSNGAYSGSSLQLSFKTTAHNTYVPGVYTVVSLTDYVVSDMSQKYIFVANTVGANVNTGAVRYEGTGGQIEITVDAQGKPHFTHKAPITMNKKIEVLGGIPGAPQTMTLTLKDVH